MSKRTLSAVIAAWMNGKASRRLPYAVIAALLEALAAEPDGTEDYTIMDFCGYNAA